MSWEELLDITPGMFYALMQRRAKAIDRRTRDFQFLATVQHRCVGDNETNYVPEFGKPGPSGKYASPEQLTAQLSFLARKTSGKARKAPRKPNVETRKTDG